MLLQSLYLSMSYSKRRTHAAQLSFAHICQRHFFCEIVKYVVSVVVGPFSTHEGKNFHRQMSIHLQYKCKTYQCAQGMLSLSTFSYPHNGLVFTKQKMNLSVSIGPLRQTSDSEDRSELHTRNTIHIQFVMHGNFLSNGTQWQYL